jgi:hypothetical protein
MAGVKNVVLLDSFSNIAIFYFDDFEAIKLELSVRRSWPFSKGSTEYMHL